MSIAPSNSKPSSHSYLTVELYVDDVFEILPFLSSGGPPQSTPVEYTVTGWLTTVTHVTMCGRAIRGYNTTSVGVLRVTVIYFVSIWRGVTAVLSVEATYSASQTSDAAINS